MKKIIKNPLLTFILGALIFGGIGVASAYGILANNIGYTPKDTTWKKSNGEDITNVKDAIDELYNKTSSSSSLLNKICTYQSEGSYGQKGQVGALYDCEVGPNIHKNFYILTIRDKEVDMLMDRNITQGTSKTTMTWAEAMKYVNSNNLNNTWNNVLNIKLPSAQAIANAIGNNYFDITSGVSRLCFEDKNNSATCTHTNYDDLWLWDYTRECQGCNNSLSSTEAYGYWTENLVNTTSYSWIVYRYGQLSYDIISSSGDYGFRPVITVLKSQLN